MKSMYKFELALAAGISTKTLQRWLRKHRKELEELGISVTAKQIPPIGVEFICSKFQIEIPRG